MRKALSIITFILLWMSVLAQQKDPFQLIDLHIHLKGGFTIDDAVKKSISDNIKYGIAVECRLKAASG